MERGRSQSPSVDAAMQATEEALHRSEARADERFAAIETNQESMQRRLDQIMAAIQNLTPTRHEEGDLDV